MYKQYNLEGLYNVRYIYINQSAYYYCEGLCISTRVNIFGK